MEIKLLSADLASLEAEVLMVPVFDKDSPRDQNLNSLTGNWLNEIFDSGEFTGKLYDTVLLYRPQNLQAKRLLLVGCGKQDKFTPTLARRVAGAAVRALKGKAIRHLAFASTPEYVGQTVEGAILADYDPDILKTCDKSACILQSFTVVVPLGSSGLKEAVRTAQIVAEATNLTRSLQNEPSNLLTPLKLADHAREIGTAAGLEVEVLDEARMRQLGMGSLLGVAMGSDNPPALIILRYTPEHAASEDHLAIIGKGVTFDTGGVSIKPSEGMEKMKYDMSGGAAAIGAMRAIAQLKPSVRVTAFIPAVENMINGKAQRPGDIVTSLNGKTIEVLNTDAEGRLILADAITYAIRQGCTHLIDAATLTGAIVVALGTIHIGAFSNNDALMTQVAEAGREAGESVWRMPLDEEYKELLKNPYADLSNIGGRAGGAISAAKFLEEFVEDKPWVHLDIAGTAWLDEAKPWMPKGPAGSPLRTFVNLAINWRANHS